MRHHFFLIMLGLMITTMTIHDLEATPGPVRTRTAILRSRDSGMFSIFFDVLALLQSYEKGLIRNTNLRVDFGETGYYYDREYGPNWWEYYFEPIAIGHAKSDYSFEFYGGVGINNIDPQQIEFQSSREEAHALIQKYVHLKPFLQEKIDRFVQEHFSGYTILGIHYRGTDKTNSEAPRVAYQLCAIKVRKVLKRLSNYKLFIATDEQDFLDYMSAEFPGKVCSLQGAERSTGGQPLHTASSSPYKHGEEAVMDCLLLSRTDVLMRTSSNLSKTSTYFNPKLRVIELSQRKK